jgi:hypothetical protein
MEERMAGAALIDAREAGAATRAAEAITPGRTK